MDYPDETLMAYADGELATDRMAEIAAAAARDATVAARIALYVQSRAAVAHALRTPAPVVNDPMIALIRDLEQKAKAATAPSGPKPDNVVPFRAVRQVPFWQLPLAASVALAVGISGALLISGPAETNLADLTLTQGGDVSQALMANASGSDVAVAEGRMRIIASFTTDDGTFCRECELDDSDGRTVVSVACRTDAEWHLQLAILAASDASGYAPASSLDSLDAWLVATGATAPLTSEDEAKALAQLR